MDNALIALIVLLILLAVSVAVFIILVRRSQQPAQPVEGHIETADTVSTEVRDAVAALRDRVPGGKFQDRVPWILLIGEPGSGKTTLLDQMATGAAGVPLPRDGVQWRFLEGGALIDVPGSFLLDASGKAQKDGRWERLLRLLMRHRPARPIDGVVLTIPASRLMPASETEASHLMAESAALRNSLDEIQKLVGMVVPVYVLVTKCDQIRGFGSFCWEINPDLDDDIFGWSNPNTLESAFASEWVDQAFDAVRDGVLHQQMRIFGSRASSPAADEMFVFPMEFDRMRQPLRGYLTQLLRETAYVDSNFLRGIYFCGDGSIALDRSAEAPVRGSSGLSLLPAVQQASPGWLPPERNPFVPALPGSPAFGANRAGRQVIFARHLFDFKVFQESKIARPIANTHFSRNRAVVMTQMAAAIFAVVFGIGTFVAWLRLSHARDHHFVPLLDALTETLPAANSPTKKVPSVQTAWDLIDTLTTMNASGFRAIFLPASWSDPIGNRISDALSGAFARTVFPAIQQGLNSRGLEVIDSCKATPAAAAGDGRDAAQNAGDTGGIAAVSFTKDPNYLALDQFVTRFNAYDSALQQYENIRRSGSGTYTDLDKLFQYLLGKNLTDPQALRTNQYFQRALSAAVAEPVPVMANDYLDKCAQQKATALIDNFYSSWFTSNPLLLDSETVAEGVDNLENNRIGSTDDLASLSLEIRELDAKLSASNVIWLTGPDFDPATYPVLTQMKGARFATQDFITATTQKGAQDLAALKSQLFNTGTAAMGSVLGAQGTDLHVSGAVLSLELAIDGLLQQDFMQPVQSVPVMGTNIIWNKAALARAGQLKDSYDKFIRDRLALLPSALHMSLQTIAAQNLASAVRAAVSSAQEQKAGDDDASTLLEIRSFKDAAPILGQLQSSAGITLAQGSNINSLLTAQGLSLAQRLNKELTASGAYSYSLTPLSDWDGTAPLSHLIFGVDSADGLEQYLAAQHDRISSLALEYAQPIGAWLQGQGLQQAANFSRWAAVIRDVQDYEAKKPGNAIATLETFIRSDLDKITPANACKTGTAGPPSNDYFLQIRTNIQRAAVSACSGTAMRAYDSAIADFFNSKLAGKFPFGPLSPIPGAAQASPWDTGTFLNAVAQKGPALVNFVASQPSAVRAADADILAFIDQSGGVWQMFAGGLNQGAPYADVTVYFRVNQAAEQNGNEIIDWEFQSGDQKIHYPGPVNGVRWHYGDTVRLTIRYAKDSPDIPQPGGAGADARVDGHTVTWEASGGWSLFTLLNRHSGSSSDFGATPEELASTMRFVIATTPDTSRIKPGNAAPQPVGQTRVYIRFGLRPASATPAAGSTQAAGAAQPVAKDMREVPIGTFPFKAPIPPAPQ